VVQIERSSPICSRMRQVYAPGGEVRVVWTAGSGGGDPRGGQPAKAFRPNTCRTSSTGSIAVRGAGEQASPEKGLGLGLSFVRGLSRARRIGRYVQSEAERDTFVVRLPLSGRKCRCRLMKRV